jgi:hypothetical protein
LWEQQLLELAQTVKQQQQSLDDIKASLVPARNVQTKGKFSNDA